MSQSISDQIFGSFFLDQTEFALSVDCLQDVVNFPERVTPMPLAPPFLLGIFNLRGMIIPIVDLRRLLNFPSEGSPDSQKVAIVNFEGARVGLLFDATGEILRVQSEQKKDFEYSPETVHRVIRGALKLEGGARILQVLDPQALLKIENLPHILEKQASSSRGVPGRSHLQAQRRQCISFMLGGTRLAFEINAIHEIIKVPELQKSLVNQEFCVGTIHLRGTVIPVVDFARILGFSSRGNAPASDDERRVVIMKLGDSLFGLLIDAVESIVTYYLDEIMPIPLLTKARSTLFSGCISKPGAGDIILLRHDEILTRAEIREITQGHSKLYEVSRAQDSRGRRSAQKRVYISFRLEYLVGVSIQEIREIIEYPRAMIKPPGVPTYIQGVMNLRGQVITIVDLRELYRMGPAPDRSSAKVLIVHRGDERYGLVVDSVESILSIDENDKILIPSLLSDGAEKAFHGDMKEMVEIDGTEGQKRGLVILNTEPLTQRLLSASAA